MTDVTGGAVDRILDLRFTGRGFKSLPGIIMYWAWASYLHLCASVTRQYNLLLAKELLRSVAGKVTVGLASHWLCVTVSGISTYGLMAKGREISTLPMLL